MTKTTMMILKLVFQLVVFMGLFVKPVDGVSEHALTLDEIIEEEVYQNQHLHEQDDHTKDEDEAEALERPELFSRKVNSVECHENGVVASWCDTHLDPQHMECRLWPDMDAYACSCVGAAPECPTECVVGGDGKPTSELLQKTKYGIACQGIPQDEPNYILKEMRYKRATNRCENNALVANWCDDYQNVHLECHIDELANEYSCKCGHKHAACPDECIGGTIPPLQQVPGIIRCKGIPLDQPNYILQEEE